MKKEVLVSVKGLHFQENQGEEAIESITPGDYYDKGDSRYVLYEEVMEGVEEPIKNIIKFKDSYLEITKKGPLNVHLVFEEGKKNLTSYATPFGNFLIGVDTERVVVQETEKEITIQVAYLLEANYEFLAKAKLSIRIEER